MNRMVKMLPAILVGAMMAPALAQPLDVDRAFEGAVTCAAMEALLSDQDAPPMDAAAYAKKAEAILDGTDPKLADYAKKKVSTGKAKSISEANNQIGAETKQVMEAWAEKTADERLAKFNSCAAEYGA